MPLFVAQRRGALGGIKRRSGHVFFIDHAGLGGCKGWESFGFYAPIFARANEVVTTAAGARLARRGVVDCRTH